MLTIFKENLKAIVGENFANKKYIVAVSGGADSMVLTHLCMQIGINFTIAHCNFALRASESDADAAFVEKTAVSWSLPIKTITFNTNSYAEQHNISTQVAARQLRYSWFDQLKTELHAEYILVAHHKDDNVETFFINLLRGTGLKGITGIKPLNNNAIVRPLLCFSKQDILQYAQDKGIAYREDSSNASDKYLRNDIRHNLLPLLETIRPGAASKIDQEISFFNQAQEELNYWSNYLKTTCWLDEANRVLIAIDALRKVSNPLYYLIDWLLPFGFNPTQLQDIWEANQVGAKVQSASHYLVFDRKQLILAPIESTIDVFQRIDSVQNHNPYVNLSEVTPSEVKFDETNKIAFLASEKVHFPLIYRNWKAGDFIRPLGMKGNKKLVSDILIDAKVDEISKKQTFLVEDAHGEIIWLPNHCIADSVKINNSTKKVLLMKIV